MYDMYPEAWRPGDRHPSPTEAAEPRRRARKVHSVLPPVLTLPASSAERGRSAA
jgi:hypothetical protein